MLWSDPFALLTSQLSRPGGFVPAGDVAVGEDDLVLTFDVPGLTSDDLSVEIQDDFLVLRGERKRPNVDGNTSFVHVERPFGAFERRVRVPRGINPDRITASLNDGVLSLIVSKPERMKPKAIAIGTGTEQRELETATA